MLCIWYLFLCMASFSFLESRAIFTVFSFFTVITTGLMNSSSVHLSSLMICFSSISFWSSCSSLSSRWSGTLLPSCWDDVYWDLNIDFAIWFFDRPNLVQRCGYLWNIHFMMFFSVWIFEIRLFVLPGFFCALRFPVWWGYLSPLYCSFYSPLLVLCNLWLSTILNLVQVRAVLLFLYCCLWNSCRLWFLYILIFSHSGSPVGV